MFGKFHLLLPTSYYFPYGALFFLEYFLWFQDPPLTIINEDRCDTQDKPNFAQTLSRRNWADIIVM